MPGLGCARWEGMKQGKLPGSSWEGQTFKMGVSRGSRAGSHALWCWAHHLCWRNAGLLSTWAPSLLQDAQGKACGGCTNGARRSGPDPHA